MFPGEAEVNRFCVGSVLFGWFLESVLLSIGVYCVLRCYQVLPGVPTLHNVPSFPGNM